MSDFIEIKNLPADHAALPKVLAIGVFDGVHAGHRAVISSAVELARKCGAVPFAVTFVPHPRQVVSPESVPPLLISESERLELLTAAGAAGCAVINFTPEVASWRAAEFVRQLLEHPVLQPAGICVGSKWRFARRGEGDTRLLEQLCRKAGIAFAAVPEVEDQGRIVSSSVIRELIATGELPRAEAMLGRRCSLCGEVVHGMNVATGKLDAPTANLKLFYGVVPPEGVYAGRCRIGDADHPAVLNIGQAPTFNVAEKRIEVHIPGFSGSLYGTVLQVELSGKIRGICRFSSPEALKEQIKCDILKAVEIFSAKEGAQ